MSDESKKRVFNKYEDNRRLWDTAENKYATIQDVLNAVVLGEDVSVIASRGRGKAKEAGRDVTAQVLLDALHHQQRENPTLEANDLVRLIRGENPWPEE